VWPPGSAEMAHVTDVGRHPPSVYRV